MTYAEKLKDPRWQKKRLEIFQRDCWTCQFCGETGETLVVHHLIYQRGKEPWEYVDDNLLTICWSCHQTEYESRSDAEGELIEFLKVYKFTAMDVYELRDMMGRNWIKNAPPAEAGFFLGLIDSLLRRELNGKQS